VSNAQPALVHVEHRAARCLLGNGVLRLALGAHEENDSPLGGQVLHEFRRLFEHLQRLLQVNNVDPIALAEDVLLHARVPPFRLMPEVNTSFEQLLHGDVCQSTSLFGLHPSATGPGLPFPSTPTRGRWGDEFNT